MGSLYATRNRIRLLYCLCLAVTVGVSLWCLVSLRGRLDHFLDLNHCQETAAVRSIEEGKLRSTVDSLLLASMFGAVVFGLLAILVEAWLNRVHARRLESAGMFHAILHSAPCGIALLDKELHYLELNAAMAEINQKPRDTHPGKSLSEVSAPWLRSIESKIRAALADGSRIALEISDRGADYTVTGYPILTTEKQIFGMALMINDITANKEQERRLAELAMELKRSNNELERFAYLASHDLKEPIRMISTYLGLFLDQYGDRLDARAKSFLSYPEEGAQRLGRLVDSLLRYGRLGQTKPEIVPCAVRELVDEVVESLRPMIAETRAELTVDIDVPTINADRTQLAQLLQNLISNALKFSREANPPKIDVKVTANGENALISIADNGVGIAEDQQERIFELFCRLNSRAKFPGEGIGLATCKRIMVSHGGRIWVTSKKGSGATFWAEFTG